MKIKKKSKNFSANGFRRAYDVGRVDFAKKNASMIWFSVRVRRSGMGLYGATGWL